MMIQYNTLSHMGNKRYSIVLIRIWDTSGLWYAITAYDHETLGRMDKNFYDYGEARDYYNKFCNRFLGTDFMVS